MMFNKFIFKKYRFNSNDGTLELHYSFDNELNFMETMKFQIEGNEYSNELLDKALFNLFIMAGVSYYKAYQVNEIEILDNKLSNEDAAFFAKTYRKGLGEYYFVNNLDPKKEIYFPVKSSDTIETEMNSPKLLIGIGGGKDSLVSLEVLKKTNLDIATWSLNHSEQLSELISKTGVKHYRVERIIDSRLITENEKGALNGHIPISAILSFVGTVQAILAGRTDVVVSNEQTANEPNLNYMGENINHQYSKSSEYEKDFQSFLKNNYGNGLRYYSFLRPLSELKIAEIFSRAYLDKYLGSFSSCNRAFRLESNKMSWCGECPKCAFVFLALTPFVDKRKLEEIFHSKNLLFEDSLDTTYRELLGIEGNKPLECVGEIKESRSAMRMAFEIYPELKSKYVFDIPEDYNYQNMGPDLMPEDIKEIFNSNIN